MKKIFVFMFLAVLMISMVSSFDFDNHKENYDYDKKEVTISNIFGLGNIILKARLDTPQIHQVRVGYSKIAQFTINPEKNYSNVLGEFKFLDMENGAKEIEKDIDVKYWGTIKEEIIKYKCDDYDDPTTCYPNGKKNIKEKEGWIDWDKKINKNKEIVIGLFTNVSYGETVEWIPKIVGVEVPEWAIYTSNSIVTQDGNYTVQTFLNNGTFNITKDLNASYLIVAGGGGGAGGTGSGGGAGAAGGLIENNSVIINSGNYDVIVGTGGLGKAQVQGQGDNGLNSSFNNQVAIGGGGGGKTGPCAPGSAGGSGGGGAGSGGGGCAGGTGTVGQGNNGGSAGGNGGSGGGGGAGGAGGNGGTGVRGSPGAGLASSINGTSVTYAVGGEGSYQNAGAGATSTTYGSGGGGAGSGPGASGIGGVVIIRYLSHPNVTLNSPIDNFNSTTDSIIFNCTVDDVFDITNVTLYINGVANETNTSGVKGDYIFPRTLVDGDYNWTCEAYNDNSFDGRGVERDLKVDTTIPDITVENPNGTLLYGQVGFNETLNVTFTDSNLESCWYNYNGTNVTIEGCQSGIKNSTNFILDDLDFNITLYANDTVGNFISQDINWDYKLFIRDFDYSLTAVIGNLEDFVINGTTKTSIYPTQAILVYNGTETVATIQSSGTNRILSVEDFQIPLFEADTNVSFYWIFNFSDSTSVITNPYIQQVSSIVLDNCSVGSFELMNISLYDEVGKTPLTGTIELYYEVLNKPSYTTMSSLSTKIESVNNTLLCSNINLSNQNLAYSTEIKYYATDYAKELYHIQKADIDESLPLDLFDLALNDSTEFEIEYQNEDLLKVDGAIIQLQRKYISENVYEVVEAPLTGNDGTAIVHVDLDTNKYKATVVKNGVLLHTFSNIVFNCENELSGQCSQNLYAALNPQNEVPLETINDFEVTVAELGNETISITFSIPSGTPSEVNIQLSQIDQFGNETLCNTTVTSSAGSIECGFNRSIGDSQLSLKIFKDGELAAQQSYVIFEDTTNDFLGNNLIIVFLFLISIGGMAFSSPEWIVINGIVTMTLSGLLWLVNGISVIEGLGALAYLIIVGVFIIMKQSKQEDQ